MCVCQLLYEVAVAFSLIGSGVYRRTAMSIQYNDYRAHFVGKVVGHEDGFREETTSLVTPGLV